jgi:DNA-binding CsgD family transcriptional regulator
MAARAPGPAAWWGAPLPGGRVCSAPAEISDDEFPKTSAWSVLAPLHAPVAKDSYAIAPHGRHGVADSPPPELANLAHGLIAGAQRERARVASGLSDEVMLDLEVDGIRCVLISTSDHPCDGPQLSPREQEIVRMVSHGYPNKTIAAVLEISTWTVSTHLRRVFAKLGVRTRAAMVARALEHGLVLEDGLALEAGTVEPPRVPKPA